MNITPQELSNRKAEFIVIDMRPEIQRRQLPLIDLNTIHDEKKNFMQLKGRKVLICQFGIISEQVILENDLEETFSLLGGALAWDSFCREKKDLSRWCRQTVLPEIGIEGQKKLLHSGVAIVGLGGLGCTVAQALVTGGIGRLGLIDGDIVTLSNLHRQPLYCFDDVNTKKVIAAQKMLKQYNPDAAITIADEYLNESNGKDLLSGVDVIVDATDNIQARQIIDRFSKELKIPLVYGGLFRFEGHVSVLNVNGGTGYNELFPSEKSTGFSCEDAGVLGMLPGIIGNIQALETIKVIVGIQPNLIEKLMIYDGKSHRTEIINLE